MSTIGKYNVIKQLGAGGFGAVCLTQDPELHGDVSIKHINQQLQLGNYESFALWPR